MNRGREASSGKDKNLGSSQKTNKEKVKDLTTMNEKVRKTNIT